jgi:hypothetical protein
MITAIIEDEKSFNQLPDDHHKAIMTRYRQNRNDQQLNRSPISGHHSIATVNRTTRWATLSAIVE